MPRATGTLDTARAYLAAGLGVLPVRPDGKKAPALPRGHTFLREKPTDEDLVRWFSSGRNGIAIPGGKVSGHLECLDFETVSIYEAWCELVEAQIPGLHQRLCWVRTPGHYGQPGMHGRYRCPGVKIPGSMELASEPELDQWGEPVLNAGGRTGPRLLIETRGEGGYAVAPGSPPACHPTGRTWDHVGGPPLTALPDLTMLEREILICSARALNSWVSDSDQAAERPHRSQGDRLTPGDDYNRRGPDWQEILAPHGWLVMRTAGDARYWRRPGKDRGSCSATTGVCRAEDGTDLLHVFSTSVGVLKVGSYSKFRATVMLDHKGDYKAAARALAQQGYGDQQPPPKPAPARDRVTAEPKQEPEVDLPEPPPWPDPPSELAYQGLAGEIVREIEPQTESDPVAVLVQLLTMFGNACGRKKYWEVEETRHHGNLFTCLVGETAKGRKGTAAARAIKVFDHLQCGWHQRIYSGLSSGEGLIGIVRDEVWQKNKTRKGDDVEESDVLIDEGVKDKRLLIFEPEFGRVLRAMQREHNTLSPLLRQGWDTDKLASLTKQGQTATGVHLSVIGHITRPELLHLLSNVEATNGLANRILWVAVRRSKLLPFGGERVDLGPKAHKIALAVEQAQARTGAVPFDPRAAALWSSEGEIYRRLTADTPGLMGAITNRAEAQVRRLALLYALLDFSPLVRECHLLAALALWDYCERSVAWVFGNSTGSELADEILEALRSAPDRRLTGTQIRAVCGTHVKAAQIGSALALLVSNGLATQEEIQTGGRPGKAWVATVDDGRKGRKEN